MGGRVNSLSWISWRMRRAQLFGAVWHNQVTSQGLVPLKTPPVLSFEELAAYFQRHAGS